MILLHVHDLVQFYGIILDLFSKFIRIIPEIRPKAWPKVRYDIHDRSINNQTISFLIVLFTSLLSYRIFLRKLYRKSDEYSWTKWM